MRLKEKLAFPCIGILHLSTQSPVFTTFKCSIIIASGLQQPTCSLIRKGCCLGTVFLSLSNNFSSLHFRGLLTLGMKTTPLLELVR